MTSAFKGRARRDVAVADASGRMQGKTVIVTGGNAGIGRETARGLAERGARVVLAVRDPSSGEEARRDVVGSTANRDVEVMHLDLASFADVRRFADEFLRTHARLDVLVNNAGLHTSKRVLTVDGHETTFQVNHLSPFLLTSLLLDALKRSAPSRVVTVASDAHRGGTLRFLEDPDSTRSWSGLRAYANSKLANVLFALSLARRLEGTGVASFAVHPGSVRTGWGRGRESGVFRFGVALASPLLLSPPRGARTSVYAASSPELDGKTGLYLARSAPAVPTRDAQDMAAAQRLWDLSLRMTGLASPPRPGGASGSRG